VLTIAGGQVRHGDRDLLTASLHAAKLVRCCRDRRIHALTFAAGLELAELGALVGLLVDPRKRSTFAPGTIHKALANLGITRIGVELSDGALMTPKPNDSGTGPATPPGPARAIRQYQAMSELLQDSHVAAARGHEVDLDRAEGVVEQTVMHIVREPAALLALTAYDDIDSYTVGHSVRVALLALQVARAAGTHKRALLRIGTAALLHDIGKSRIAQHVLFKRGVLDDEERAEMARHPRLGAEILLEQKRIDPSAIGAAFCHHMKANGQGYPVPAFPFQPSGISKLVQVCDVYEALTAVRPYKRALTPLQAFTVMHGMRDAFAPEYLDYFMQVIGIYPPGTRVILTDGSEAVVLRHGLHPTRPIVRRLGGSFQKQVDLEIGVPQEGTVAQIAAIVGANERIPLPTELLRPTCLPGCSCELHVQPVPLAPEPDRDPRR
jgi:putative nucleotidyltransferase with HDIG domain